MSEGMFGKLPLEAVLESRNALDRHLAGEGGKRWLEAFNEFLAGVNPWPIVSNVVTEGCYIITVGDGKSLDEITAGPNFRHDYTARQVMESKQFFLEERKDDFVVVELEFEGWGLRSEHVLAEIKRLGFERPSFEDALRVVALDAEYPYAQASKKLVFLHEPVRCFPDVGPGGMAIGTGRDGKFNAVLMLDRDAGKQGVLSTADSDILIPQYTYAARRWKGL